MRGWITGVRETPGTNYGLRALQPGTQKLFIVGWEARPMATQERFQQFSFPQTPPSEKSLKEGMNIPE